MTRIVCALALLLAATPAPAQPAPWQPTRLTAGWTFTPTLGLGGVWDSNVTVRGQGENSISEWVGLVNPRGELDYNGRRTRFNAGYSGALEAYRQFTELNRYEQRGRFEARHQVSARVLLTSRAELTVAPTTDRLELGAGILPFLNVGSRLFNAGGGFTVRLSPRARLDAGYRFDDVRFDRDESDVRFQFLRGGHSHVPSAAFSYDLSRRVTLGVAAEYRQADIGAGEQTSRVTSSAVDVSYRLAEHTRVSGGGGLSYLTVSGFDEATWGPLFHGSLEQDAGRATLSVAYQRSFVPSFGFGGVSANQSLSTSARVPFAAGRYYLTGGLSYGRTSPVELLGLGFQLDSLWTLAAFGYQASSWLKAEAFYTGTHQTSTARGQVDRARIGIQLVTSKPVRIR